MPPLNKHSPPHPTNTLKKVPRVLIQGFTTSDSTLKKSSKSNPLVVQNFQDKVKIAETLVFQRTIHHPLECMPAWRKTSAHGIFPRRIHFSRIVFAVHLTLLQLNNVFQFALVCVFSTYEEKEWGCQICLN